RLLFNRADHSATDAETLAQRSRRDCEHAHPVCPNLTFCDGHHKYLDAVGEPVHGSSRLDLVRTRVMRAMEPHPQARSIVVTSDDSTEICELTPDQLEAVSGGEFDFRVIVPGWSLVTPTNICNAIQYLMNNPPQPFEPRLPPSRGSLPSATRLN